MDFRKSVANGKKLLADKKGTSIVSVMVAFSILMLGILMMTTSTTVSLKLINESGAKRKIIESAVEEYYLKGGERDFSVPELHTGSCEWNGYTVKNK